MNLYSAYDYLAYVIPGGLVLGASFFAFLGLPSAEPGASWLLVLLAAAFLIGHVIATLAAWLQPIVWGERPGTAPDPTWGMFDSSGRSKISRAVDLEAELARRYGPRDDLPTLYGLAYTELQQNRKEGRLIALNSEIGFARNAAVALLSGAVIDVAASLAKHHPLDAPWLPVLYLVGSGVFVARYRRIWRQFADNVVRGFRVLESTSKSQGAASPRADADQPRHGEEPQR
jgi:hypothetical protein